MMDLLIVKKSKFVLKIWKMNGEMLTVQVMVISNVNGYVQNKFVKVNGIVLMLSILLKISWLLMIPIKMVKSILEILLNLIT